MVMDEPDGETTQTIFLSIISSVNILTQRSIQTISCNAPFLFVCFCNMGAVYYRKIKIIIMGSFVNTAMLIL